MHQTAIASFGSQRPMLYKTDPKEEPLQLPLPDRLHAPEHLQLRVEEAISQLHRKSSVLLRQLAMIDVDLACDQTGTTRDVVAAARYWNHVLHERALQPALADQIAAHLRRALAIHGEVD